MIVAQISTIPIGTESTSISGFVAEAVRALKASGLKVMVTPTGTVVEAKNLWELFRAIEKCHEALCNAGAKRVYMVILIDDRRDVEKGMLDKVKSVQEKLGQSP